MEEFGLIYDIADFANYAAQQPEVWTHGKTGFALPHLEDNDDTLIYSDHDSWLKIIARYNQDKMKNGWIEKNGQVIPE